MKKSQPNSQDELNILTKIKINPQYSQRKLAYDLGLSLGKLNYCLKGLQQKGLIKIQNFSLQKNKVKYIQYILTPRVISERTKLTIIFMKRKMKEYDELKKNLQDN